MLAGANRQVLRYPDEAESAVIVMVCIEFVDDAQPGGSSSYERVDLDIFAEIGRRLGAHLVSIVLPDQAFARCRVIGRPDSGEQKQPHIMHLEGGKDNKVRRLLDLSAAIVDV